MNEAKLNAFMGWMGRCGTFPERPRKARGGNQNILLWVSALSLNLKNQRGPGTCSGEEARPQRSCASLG